MSEVLLKAIILIVVIVMANWMFWHLVGLFTLTVSVLAPLIVLSVLVYVAFRYLRWRSARFDKGTVYRLWNTHGKAVYVFHAEPSIEDMVTTQDELNLARLELAGEVFGVENNTEVCVLKDEGAAAVKIKIVDPQAREKIGWVPRDTVIRAAKELSG
jgi:hypothetical protein